MESLFACALDRWHPGIGGIMPMDWAAIGVYGVAFLLCFMLAHSGRFAAPSRHAERRFWGFAAAIMLLFAAGRAFDLQTLLSDAGRCAASFEGWYESRRPVRIGLILVFCASLAIGLIAGLRLVGGTLRRTALPLLGLLFAGGFVLIRAAGLHQIDALLGAQTEKRVAFHRV